MTLRKQAQSDSDQTLEVGRVGNAAGDAPLVLLCEHASNAIPAEMNQLGISDEVAKSHAAWDPGARGVTDKLSKLLNAPNVQQTVSRLVYDCNRPFDATSAIPEKSEIFEIPGNVNLSVAARLERKKRYYDPFEEKAAQTVQIACNHHRTPLVVSIHTFTPVYFGKVRAVEIGVLHDEDARLVDQLLGTMQSEQTYQIERNEPYGPTDGVTHTIDIHATSRGLPAVMIEVRNDLLRDDAAEQVIANYLAQHLRIAMSRFFPGA